MSHISWCFFRRKMLNSIASEDKTNVTLRCCVFLAFLKSVSVCIQVEITVYLSLMTLEAVQTTSWQQERRTLEWVSQGGRGVTIPRSV